MKLYLNSALVGELSEYSYETPWATARIAPADAAAYKRLCAAGRFLAVDVEEDWGDLTREEEDREYARRLVKYGIVEADVDAFQSGRWEIINSDSTHLQGPVWVNECDERGWVTWRWG